MRQHLIITIRLHDSRYHGAGEWPPAPARVFQALVAAVACGNRFPDGCVDALEWLERLPPPIVAAPNARRGQRVEMFVPNNDADALGGDLGRLSSIRAKKVVEPWLIEGEGTFVYAWPFEEGAAHVETIERMADGIYQLGRGVDMAYANVAICGAEALDAILARHRGSVHRPGGASTGPSLACPVVGSLASLVRRYDEALVRIRSNKEASTGGQLFVQPAKPHFAQVGYGARSARRLYELRRREGDSKLYPWPLSRVTGLVERLRDRAAARLRDAVPELSDAVERVVIGRKADGADAGPTEQRVRIIPLPSIGHEHADRAVRRVLVEVPPEGPLSVADIEWAFSALETIDPDTGEEDGFILTPSDDDRMLRQYAATARRWRSVTPAALPMAASRRRIEPTRRREEAKGAAERGAEEERAAAAVSSALRHAGVNRRVVNVRVRREPFTGKGARAEAFAPGTRFEKERLWHVDVELDEAVDGPLALGDGRFLGLGLFAPERLVSGAYVWTIEEGLSANVDPVGLARALRRAVMARTQESIGRRPLPTFFSGHSDEGGPASSETSPHLAFHFAPPDRLVILSPHAMDGRALGARERRWIELLERTIDELVELRAGRAGRLRLRRVFVDEGDRLLASAAKWTSCTPYTVTRHGKRELPSEVIANDVVRECLRRGLPRPSVSVTEPRGIPGHGLQGRVTLDFPSAISGPLVLGRTRFLGGGLFAAAPSER